MAVFCSAVLISGTGAVERWSQQGKANVSTLYGIYSSWDDNTYSYDAQAGEPEKSRNVGVFTSTLPLVNGMFGRHCFPNSISIPDICFYLRLCTPNHRSTQTGGLILSSVYTTSQVWSRQRGSLQPFRAVDVSSSRSSTEERHPPTPWIMALSVESRAGERRYLCLAMMLSYPTHALTTRQCMLSKMAPLQANGDGSGSEREAIVSGTGRLAQFIPIS